MSEIYLVRHGQASFGAVDYDQLSNIGWQQSQWLGEYFAMNELEFDACIIGSLKRHRQTFDGIAMAMNNTIADPIIDGDWNEYAFRDIANKFASLNPQDPDVLACAAQPEDRKGFFRLFRKALNAWANDELGHLNESWQAFQIRLNKAMQQLKLQSTNHQRILVVSSGGPISSCMGNTLDLSPNKTIDLNLLTKNTSIAQLLCIETEFLLTGFNQTPHLDSVARQPSVTYA